MSGAVSMTCECRLYALWHLNQSRPFRCRAGYCNTLKLDGTWCPWEYSSRQKCMNYDYWKMSQTEIRHKTETGHASIMKSSLILKFGFLPPLFPAHSTPLPCPDLRNVFVPPLCCPASVFLLLWFCFVACFALR